MNSLQQSESINEISAAIVKAQSEMVSPKKESNNPFFKSKYADLATCWDSCKEPIANNGLCVMQGFVPMENGSVLVTRLLHASGQWIESHLSMSFLMSASPEKVDKYGKVTPSQPERNMTPQEIGAAITYFRRFSLCALLGICPEDDDGNTASRNTHETKASLVIDANKGMYLEQKLSECDPVYVQKMNSYIKDTLKAPSIRLLREEHFEDTRRAIEQASEAYKKQVQHAV